MCSYRQEQLGSGVGMRARLLAACLGASWECRVSASWIFSLHFDYFDCKSRINHEWVSLWQLRNCRGRGGRGRKRRGEREESDERLVQYIGRRRVKHMSYFYRYSRRLRPSCVCSVSHTLDINLYTCRYNCQIHIFYQRN